MAAISDTTARTSAVAERVDGSALQRSEKRSMNGGESCGAAQKQRKLRRNSSRSGRRVWGSVSVKQNVPVEGGERSRVHSVSEARGVGQHGRRRRGAARDGE